MTKCQTLRKFWHLEIFWWDSLCNLTLSHFSGRTSKKNHPVYVYCLFWAHFLILVIFLISRVSNNIVCPTFECLLEWWFIFSAIYHRIFVVQNIMIDYIRWHYFGPKKFFLKCSRPMYLLSWVCFLLRTLTSSSLYFCTSIPDWSNSYPIINSSPEKRSWRQLYLLVPDKGQIAPFTLWPLVIIHFLINAF